MQINDEMLLKYAAFLLDWPNFFVVHDAGRNSTSSPPKNP